MAKGEQLSVPGTPEALPMHRLSEELNEAVAEVADLERSLRGARARERMLRREMAGLNRSR